MDKLKVAFLWWFTIPHLLFWQLSKNKKVINEDIDSWGKNLRGVSLCQIDTFANMSARI